MQLVEQHVIRANNPQFEAIDAAAFAAKNLYWTVHTGINKTQEGAIEYQRDEHRVHLFIYHLFMCVWSSDSAADVVKECKGPTSYELRLKHPSLKRLPSLWTRSYFAATAGNLSTETVRRSIEAQKGR